VKIYDETVVLW